MYDVILVHVFQISFQLSLYSFTLFVCLSLPSLLYHLGEGDQAVRSALVSLLTSPQPSNESADDQWLHPVGPRTGLCSGMKV